MGVDERGRHGPGFFTIHSVTPTDAIDQDDDSYVLVDEDAWAANEQDSPSLQPPFTRRAYVPPPQPAVTMLWGWVSGTIFVASMFMLPIAVLSLAVPIASFFALPLLAAILGVLFYVVPVISYLLVAQDAPPPHMSRPFRPPLRHVRLLLRINIAVLRWIQRAFTLAWTVGPEIVKTKILYMGTNNWSGRMQDNIPFGSPHPTSTLDVYIPKPIPPVRLLIRGASTIRPTSSTLAYTAQKAPSASELTLAPVIIFVPSPHYGYLRAKKWMMSSLGRNLARMGYCVIIPDLVAFGDDLPVIASNKVKSQGQKNGRANTEASRIRESSEDLRRVMRWAWDNAAKYGGDKEKIYLAGHGLGAHLALLHTVQRAVVSSRESLFKAFAEQEPGSETPPPAMSNGTRRVKEYGNAVWAPPVLGLILLSPVCDVEKQVLLESELGTSHLSTVRRSLGPGQLPCIMHSPAHILHASRNIIEVERLPKKIVFIHGGFDRVVNWSQSENMKELLRGVGVEDVKTRVYTTGHSGVLTALMSHTRGSVLSAHISREIRIVAPPPLSLNVSNNYCRDMARLFCIPGVLLLILATAVGVLVSISLPTVHTFDVVRLRFETAGGAPNNTEGTIDSVRWGIWGYCEEPTGKNDFNCHHTGLTYAIRLGSTDGGSDQTVGGSYTRGLVLHPIALAATFVALVLSFSQKLMVTLLASFTSFLAALLSLIAFAIDIALYVRVRHQANDLKNAKSNTDFGPAFWMTLAQIILLVLAGASVCLGRRQERVARGEYNSYPMLDKRPWYRRFARN